MMHNLEGRIRLLSKMLLVSALWVFGLCSACAADEVDIAVDAFAIAGSSVGFTLNENEKIIVKAIVRCVGKSVNGKKLELDVCARDEVVVRLPKEAQPLVACLLKGKPVDGCSVEGMLDRLPAEARGITQCIAQGKPLTECGTEEALRRLPEQTRWIAQCVGSGRAFQNCASEAAFQGLPRDVQATATCVTQRPDFGRCVNQAPLGAVYRQALNVIDKLKADNRTDLGNGSSASIRNIIQVADGIREDDWIKVSYYGGAEVYKVAAKIVLNIILTPVFQPLIGPIADAVIQHRVDLFARLVRAIKNADQSAVTEIAIEGYMIMQVEVACALPMPNDMRETLCGTVGTIIKGIASAGGDLADVAGRLIERPLAIPSTLWDETQRGRELASGKATGCESPPVYYAQTYARCYQRGAKLIMTDPRGVEGLTASLNNMCRQYYDGCYFSNRFDGLCNPQREMFTKHANQVARGLDQAATAYARNFGGSITNAIVQAGPEVCKKPFNVFVANEIDDFKLACARDLKVQVPAKGNPLSDTCGGKSTLRDSPHWLACERALDAVHPIQTAAGACRDTWPHYVRLGKRTIPNIPLKRVDVGLKIIEDVQIAPPQANLRNRALDVPIAPPPVNPAIKQNLNRSLEMTRPPPQVDPSGNANQR